MLFGKSLMNEKAWLQWQQFSVLSRIICLENINVTGFEEDIPVP